MKKTLTKIALGLLCLALVFTSCNPPSYSKAMEDVKTPVNLTNYEPLDIKPIQADSNEIVSAVNSSEYIRGFDASALYALERNGAIFYDSDNSEKDMLTILKNHGVNWIRLRVWNNPYSQAAGTAGNTGFCDIKKAKEISVRAKALGMKVLIDFHYSDTWADPVKQNLPAAWDKYANDADALADAVYDFTKRSLTILKEAGATPDMVQIGNEIDSGMFLKKSDGTTVAFNKSDLPIFLAKASAAVKDVDSNIKVMIHTTSRNSGNNAKDVLDLLDSSIYDVIGLSYYPFYDHGNLETLSEIIKGIKTALPEKDVVIAETSFAWTVDWVQGKNDDTNNILYYTGEASLATAKDSLVPYSSEDTLSSSLEIVEYENNKCVAATVDNQAEVIRAIMEVSANAGAKGIFYWGGELVSTTTIPSSWENQALFDLDGKVLPSIDVFGLRVNLKQEKIMPVTIILEGFEEEVASVTVVNGSEVTLSEDKTQATLTVSSNDANFSEWIEILAVVKDAAGNEIEYTGDTWIVFKESGAEITLTKKEEVITFPYTKEVTFTGGYDLFLDESAFEGLNITSLTVQASNFNYSGNWWACIGYDGEWKADLSWDDSINGYSITITDASEIQKYLTGLYVSGEANGKATVTVSYTTE